MKLFRMGLTVGLVVAAVGLLVTQQAAGLAVLPLAGAAVRFWFPRQMARRTRRAGKGHAQPVSEDERAPEG